MINIIVVGKSGVGKTSLINRYVNNEFNYKSHQPTVGMTFSIKKLNTKPKGKIKLQIWDTAGSEAYLKQINQAYINAFWKNVNGFVIISDQYDNSSFGVANEWLELIQKYVHKDNDQRVPLIYVINKCDEEIKNESEIKKTDMSTRPNLELSYDETSQRITTVIQQFGLKEIFQVSSKTGHNVEFAFDQLINLIQKQQCSQNQLTLRESSEFEFLNFQSRIETQSAIEQSIKIKKSSIIKQKKKLKDNQTCCNCNSSCFQ